MAAEHAELIGEMSALEKMSVSERLKQAKKRRTQQLKAHTQYEKQLMKETSNLKKSKKNQNVVSQEKKTRLCFSQSVLLLDAVGRSDIDEVKDLLNRGVNPNLGNEDGLTALHQCSIDDSEEIMKLLVQFGADVTARDSELWTPLHAAATCGYLMICKYLCEHGAELLAVNADGNMPYDLCEDAATLDYIESEMAKQGVTQEMIDDIRLSAENKMLVDMKQIANDGGDLEYRGRNGETPLHIAACNGYIYVMELLLAHNVSVNVTDDDDWQPIHCSACWGQLPVLEFLLEHGADIEAKTKNGESTLDLCEDIEMKQRVLEIIDEIRTKRPHKPRESGRRRNSAQRRGSSVNLAMRRTSVHEKTSIAHKEAHEEAQRLQESILSLHNDDDDDDEIVIDAITTKHIEIGDVNISEGSSKIGEISKQMKVGFVNQKPLKSILSTTNSSKSKKQPSATSNGSTGLTNRSERKTTELNESKQNILSDKKEKSTDCDLR